MDKNIQSEKLYLNGGEISYHSVVPIPEDASLAAFAGGMSYAWPSPAIPKLISNDSIVPMSLEQASYFTVIPPISMILAAPIFGILVETIGRKRTLLLIVIPQIISWILKACADSIAMFYLARFFVGVNDACIFISVPVYIAECTVPKIRGTWGNALSVSLYGGQFLINVFGSYQDIRTTSYICLAFPVLFLLTFSFMPETPYYYIMKGKMGDARNSLRRLHGKQDVEYELSHLKADVHRQMCEAGTLRDLFYNKTNRNAMSVAVGMRTAQQASGFPAFAVYTQYIFQQAGGNIPVSTSAIVYTGSMTLMILISSFMVDKFGRRPLMIFSSIASGIVLAIETVYFFCKDYTSYDLTNLRWIPIVGMTLYIVVYSSGLGIIPTLMLGELFSASVKGKALSVMNIYFGCLVLTSSKLFQVLASSHGLYLPFLLFTICCLLGAVYSYYYVPETKGKTLEEIQQHFRGKTEICSKETPSENHFIHYHSLD